MMQSHDDNDELERMFESFQRPVSFPGAVHVARRANGQLPQWAVRGARDRPNQQQLQQQPIDAGLGEGFVVNPESSNAHTIAPAVVVVEGTLIQDEDSIDVYHEMERDSGSDRTSPTLDSSGGNIRSRSFPETTRTEYRSPKIKVKMPFLGFIRKKKEAATSPHQQNKRTLERDNLLAQPSLLQPPPIPVFHTPTQRISSPRDITFTPEGTNRAGVTMTPTTYLTSHQVEFVFERTHDENSTIVRQCCQSPLPALDSIFDQQDGDVSSQEFTYNPSDRQPPDSTVENRHSVPTTQLRPGDTVAIIPAVDVDVDIVQEHPLVRAGRSFRINELYPPQTHDPRMEVTRGDTILAQITDIFPNVDQDQARQLLRTGESVRKVCEELCLARRNSEDLHYTPDYMISQIQEVFPDVDVDVSYAMLREKRLSSIFLELSEQSHSAPRMSSQLVEDDSIQIIQNAFPNVKQEVVRQMLQSRSLSLLMMQLAEDGTPSASNCQSQYERSRESIVRHVRDAFPQLADGVAEILVKDRRLSLNSIMSVLLAQTCSDSAHNESPYTD